MILSLRNGESELVVKKSRFIAVARAVSCRDDVSSLVAELRSKHREARHVCYGCVVDEDGKDFGYDDDGEPSGTAGRPIYQALENAGVRRAAVAVVRYFGGIKLGAGGLTRAYREAAAGVIAKSLAKVELQSIYDVVASGDCYKKVAPILRSLGCVAQNIIYGANVSFTVCARADIDIAGALTALGAQTEHIRDVYTEVN